MKTVDQNEGKGSSNAPFLSSERRICNIRPFQQTGVLNNQQESSKAAGSSSPGKRAAQKVEKLKSMKQLAEFNKQDAASRLKRRASLQTLDKKEDGGATVATKADTYQVPKLILDKVKNEQTRKNNLLYPLTDPERGRKRFIQGLNLSQQELNNLSKQTSVKNQLRMALVVGDRELTQNCSIMKLKAEADKVGLHLSDADYTIILLAFCMD